MRKRKSKKGIAMTVNAQRIVMCKEMVDSERCRRFLGKGDRDFSDI